MFFSNFDKKAFWMKRCDHVSPIIIFRCHRDESSGKLFNSGLTVVITKSFPPLVNHVLLLG